MCQGGGAEKKSAGGGIDVVEHGKDLKGLRQATRDGHIFQIIEAVFDGLGCKLGGSGGEPTDSLE